MSKFLIKFIEKLLGVLQVAGIETLGEPIPDFGKHRTRLITTTLLRQQEHETRGGAQLPRLCSGRC